MTFSYKVEYYQKSFLAIYFIVRCKNPVERKKKERQKQQKKKERGVELRFIYMIG